VTLFQVSISEYDLVSEQPVADRHNQSLFHPTLSVGGASIIAPKWTPSERPLAHLPLPQKDAHDPSRWTNSRVIEIAERVHIFLNVETGTGGGAEQYLSRAWLRYFLEVKPAEGHRRIQISWIYLCGAPPYPSDIKTHKASPIFPTPVTFGCRKIDTAPTRPAHE
jgi:hypothetical protein